MTGPLAASTPSVTPLSVTPLSVTSLSVTHLSVTPVSAPALSVAQHALGDARLRLARDSAAGAGRTVVSQGVEEVARARHAVAEAQAAAVRDATAARTVDLFL